MKKGISKKLFFAYDDKKLFSCFCFLLSIISLAIFLALIVAQNTERYIVVLFLIAFVLALLLGIYISFIGIHCNLKKRTIELIGSSFVRKIELNKISYVTLKLVEKERKKSVLPLFKEKVWYLDTEYVYNNGEVFVIEFHLKNQETIKMNYTWLFGVKNKNRVEKQKNKLEALVSQMNNALKEN